MSPDNKRYFEDLRRMAEAREAEMGIRNQREMVERMAREARDAAEERIRQRRIAAGEILRNSYVPSILYDLAHLYREATGQIMDISFDSFKEGSNESNYAPSYQRPNDRSYYGVVWTTREEVKYKLWKFSRVKTVWQRVGMAVECSSEGGLRVVGGMEFEAPGRSWMGNRDIQEALIEQGFNNPFPVITSYFKDESPPPRGDSTILGGGR